VYPPFACDSLFRIRQVSLSKDENVWRAQKLNKCNRLYYIFIIYIEQMLELC